MVPAISGLAVPYFYTRGKFSWYHETALAAGVVLSLILGMLAIDPHAAWWKGILVALPAAIVLCYMGLALDEYPDAAANLKKGVKSLAYRVWDLNFDLCLYLVAWMLLLCIFQVFLIATGFLKPLTAISLILFPFVMARMVFFSPWAKNLRLSPENKVYLEGFTKEAKFLVLIAMLYPILVLIGQAAG